MSPSTTTIPRFLLPQLSWKPPNPSSLILASRKYPPPTKGFAPWNKPIHRCISSTTLRCNEQALSSLVHHRQRPLLVKASNVARNHQHYFSTTPTLSRDHHFDTLKFVQRLKDEGFSEEQSKAMMLVLSDVIEESIQNLTRTMVLREGLQGPRSRAPAKPSLTSPSCRRRSEYLHTKGRLHKTSLRASSP